MKKKIILTAGSILCVAALIFGSAYALFSARTDSDFYAKAGTVRIDLDGLYLTNADNINPGDNDLSNPSDVAGGTEHAFSYDVINNGNKSIRTRHTIIITCDEEGSDDELLDARYFEMLSNGRELEEKLYVLKDGSTKKKVGKDDFVEAVKYTFLGDIMDGNGDDIENGGDAEKEDLSGTVKQDGDQVIGSYEFDFAMLREAPNRYQGCDVNIEVIVEAMQFRNTDNKDWDIVGVVSKTYTTADVNMNVVPNYDEDKNGNKIDAIE